MLNLSEKTLLVVPCYNEALRLPIEKFLDLKKEENIFILFVNDGSHDDTEKLIQQTFSEGPFFYLSLEKNQGKGEAVRRGMLHATTLELFSELKWIGYWDADLATPLSEIPSFLKYASLFYPGADALWGSRIYRLGSHIQRRWLRHILGRLFATFAKGLLNIESYDSQCGAKLFKKELIVALFQEPFLSKWIFDIEIYMRLRGKKVVEYPLMEWADQTGSKIKIIHESGKVLRDLYRIKNRYIKKQS